MAQEKKPAGRPIKPSVERRRDPRSPLKAKVIISLPGVNRVISDGAYLRNIGKKGFAFATEDALIRGSLYHFDITTTDTHVTLTGRVMHLRTEATYYVCGVKIENISLPQRGRLNRLLAALFSGLQKKFMIYSLLAGAGAFFILKFLFGVGVGVSIVVSLVVLIAFYLLLPY